MEIRKRYFEGNLAIEKREDGSDSRKVIGHAAVFDKWSLNFGNYFREKVDKHAFDEVLDQDTVALFNHNRNMVLARNGKTLKLSLDETGLRYEFEAPNTTHGNDLLESIRRGDITGSSFQFTIKEESWAKSEIRDVEEDRTILKVDRLIDVSPVTFPAYPDTDVAKRDFENRPQPEPPKPEPTPVHERELLKEKINILRK